MNNQILHSHRKIGKAGIFFTQGIGIISFFPISLLYLIFSFQDSRVPVSRVLLEKRFLREISFTGEAYKEEEIVMEKKIGLPTRIKISKIHVDAGFEYVGLTPLGAMEVPRDPTHVAWFHLGPRPGEEGNAVVVGHYGNWKNGAKSVFDNLHLLEKGDLIEVFDHTGEDIHFIVEKVRQFDATDTTEGIFDSDSSGTHLNLITCDGSWDKVSESYSKRLVIFTDRVFIIPD